MNWRSLQLGVVCDIVSGATPRTNRPEYWDGEVRWVTPKDLSKLDEKHISDPPRRISEKGLKSCAAKMLPQGSVLLSSRAPIGLVAISAKPLCTNQGFKNLVPRDGQIDSNYLYWWLKANRDFLGGLGRGATFKEISKAIVEEISIPLPHKNGKPDLDEQKRIAAILDKADAIRRKRQQALRYTDDFLRSVFLDMFGDPVTNPKGWEPSELTAVIGNSFRNGLSPSSKGTVAGKVLTLTAITKGTFSQEHSRDAFFDRSPSDNQLVTAETFLICRGNGNKSMVGIGVFPEADMPQVAFPDTMIACTVDRSLIEPSYLQTLWSTAHVRKQIEAGARTTNGTYKVNQTLLGSIEFPLPPVSLQIEFSKIVKSLRSKSLKSASASENSENLFSSLQQRAFRGEL